MYRIELKNEQDTLTLGAALADCLAKSVAKEDKPVLCIFLQGDLGMGKTTLARGLLRALGHQGAVKSPTYTLVEHYAFEQVDFYHFDIYRLNDPEELEYMGLRDFLTPTEKPVVCLVEWPERGVGFLPAPDLIIKFTLEGQGRRLELVSNRGALMGELITQSGLRGLVFEQ